MDEIAEGINRKRVNPGPIFFQASFSSFTLSNIFNNKDHTHG